MEVGARPVLSSEPRPEHAELDAGLATLRAGAEGWARLGLAEKIRHLRAMRGRTIDAA